MKITLNTDRHEMFWFTTDGSIHISHVNPITNIESPSTLSLQTIRELVNAHDKNQIYVNNIAFLKQLLQEKLKKQNNAVAKRTTLREPQDINRGKPVQAKKEEDKALEMAMLPISKLKVAIAQTNNVMFLTDVYRHEAEKKNPRKSALQVIEKRLEELGSPLAVLEPSDDLEITDEEEKKIMVDQETGAIKDIDDEKE